MKKETNRLKTLKALLSKIFRTEPEATEFRNVLKKGIEDEYEEELTKRRKEGGRLV